MKPKKELKLLENEVVFSSYLTGYLKADVTSILERIWLQKGSNDKSFIVSYALFFFFLLGVKKQRSEEE